MSKTWFTSDLHFGHRLVAGHRGFWKADPEYAETDTENVVAHDEHIVEVWNSYVAPGDKVWVLGDMSMKGPKAFGPYVEQLNGSLHLIAGNHDEVHPMYRRSENRQRAWLEFFESVQQSASIRIDGRDVKLSHFPYIGEGARPGPDRHTQWRLRDEGAPLIHGHTHDENQRLSFSAFSPMIHVGWDAWGQPVPQESIAQMLDSIAAEV